MFWPETLQPDLEVLQPAKNHDEGLTLDPKPNPGVFGWLQSPGFDTLQQVNLLLVERENAEAQEGNESWPSGLPGTARSIRNLPKQTWNPTLLVISCVF